MPEMLTMLLPPTMPVSAYSSGNRHRRQGLPELTAERNGICCQARILATETHSKGISPMTELDTQTVYEPGAGHAGSAPGKAARQYLVPNRQAQWLSEDKSQRLVAK